MICRRNSNVLRVCILNPEGSIDYLYSKQKPLSCKLVSEHALFIPSFTFLPPFNKIKSHDHDPLIISSSTKTDHARYLRIIRNFLCELFRWYWRRCSLTNIHFPSDSTCIPKRKLIHRKHNNSRESTWKICFHNPIIFIICRSRSTTY